MMTHRELRKSYIDFFKKRDHVQIEPSSLVLYNDPTTLFTSAGMQPLISNLLGAKHPMGTRLIDIQPCFRSVDIDEVGDGRHTTFFEMMGNWSLGDYFKKEQIEWYWTFFTEVLSLPKEKLYVTIFEGNKEIPKDIESETLWKKLGVAPSHIREYDVKKNWWSRSGPPESMPEGEVGGPSSELFFEFDTVLHTPRFGSVCHPNCECGHYVEIANSVFVEYKKSNNSLQLLPQKNVDFGGGFDRIMAAIQNNPDLFTTDLFSQIITSLEELANKKYESQKSEFQVIADHIKASVMICKAGITPSNKEQGYVLRRLIRRSLVKMNILGCSMKPDIKPLVKSILTIYDGLYDLSEQDNGTISKTIQDEIERFDETLRRGLKYFNKLNNDQLSEQAFNLYQTYGFPLEVTQELTAQRGVTLDTNTFHQMNQTHKKLSKKASIGFFKGGLADQSEQVVIYHTATHLIHQALRDVLGAGVRQEGSNITGERLRFDFQSSFKPTDEEIQEVQNIVNEKISEKLPVYNLALPKSEAEKLGALSFFREKYADTVSIYCIGGSAEQPDVAYSKEFCGGPHVINTDAIGKIKIDNVKKIGSSTFRLYAS